MLPFKATAFATVIDTNFKIQPVITRYLRESDNWNPAWYGDQTLLPHVWKFIGRPVTRVEVSSTGHGVSRTYEDEFGITKCYAHLNFNTQYKLWFPEEEERPLTIIVTPEIGKEFAIQIGEKTISFGGKSFPLKQGEVGESLDALTEHLLLKD